MVCLNYIQKRNEANKKIPFLKFLIFCVNCLEKELLTRQKQKKNDLSKTSVCLNFVKATLETIAKLLVSTV